MSVTIYHNPRCSKSRAALSLLEKRGETVKIIDYLQTPPTIDELKAVLEKLGLGPRDIMRKREEPYKTFGLDDPSLPDEALLLAMTNYPVLIERPIVIKGEAAAIGRPIENIHDIL